MNGSIVQNNEGVDFKVCKVELYVDGVKPGDEVSERFLALAGLVRSEECLLDLITCGEWVRCGWKGGNVEAKGVSIDIANVDTTSGREEDGITCTSRCDADVGLCVLWVWKEWLHDEVVEGAYDCFDLNGERDQRSYSQGYDMRGIQITHPLWFSSAILDPLSCLWEGLVESQKTGFSTSLDQLIWFCDKGSSMDPCGEGIIGRDRVRRRVIRDLSYFC